MQRKKFLTRFVAAPVAVVVAAGGSLFLNGMASAAGPAGSLNFDPLTGADTTVTAAVTSGGCPTPATKVSMDIVGPIGGTNQPFPPGNPYVITVPNNIGFSNAASFRVLEDNPMSAAVVDRGQPTVPPGDYQLTVHCVNAGGAEFGTFTGTLTFTDATHYTSSTPTSTATSTATATATATPTSTATATATPTSTATATATPSPGAKATKTRLSVIRVPLPFGLGNFVIPIANVTPANAAGKVQFLDSGQPLGGLMDVSGGAAIGPISVLKGSHSLTAMFTPNDSNAFQPSTSGTVKVPPGGKERDRNEQDGNEQNGNK